jgi:MoaA/NifB/PqqE/SkfB family radical SAM enzyme
MTVLTRKNYLKIEKIVSGLAEVVDVMSIQPVVTDYKNAPHSIKAEETGTFFLEPSEETAVIESLNKLAVKYPSFNNFYFKNIPNFWFHPERLLKVKCWAPFLRLSIMPQGQAIFCGANPKYSPSLGNLNEMTLMEVWNSPALKKYREEIRRHKNNCACWTQDASFNAFMHTLPLARWLPVFKKRKMDK